MANITTLSISKLLDVYNQITEGAQLKSFKDKPTALARVEAELEKTNMVVVFDSEGGYEVANRPAQAPKAKRGPKLKAEDAAMLGKRVVVLVAENPKRGKSALRFAQYTILASGFTVSDYVSHLAAHMNRAQFQTLADVKWDVAHNFVRLED